MTRLSFGCHTNGPEDRNLPRASFSGRVFPVRAGTVSRPRRRACGRSQASAPSYAHARTYVRTGRRPCFAELEASDETAELTHADWLGLLLDRELTHRRDKRLAARLRYARLRQPASIEDVDYRAPRGLDRALFQRLTDGEWIDAHDNLILCGPHWGR
jgi:DNA replication protein DnaC